MSTIDDDAWLVVYSARNEDHVGVAVVHPLRGTANMREVLDKIVSIRNKKGIRGRRDWYCLCLIHGFKGNSRFSASILRNELALTYVSSRLGPTRSVLAKIEKVLLKNKARARNVQIVF